MKTIACQLAMAAAVAVVACGCCTVCHKEMVVPLNTVPAAVQATIQAHTYGGVVDRVEKETLKSGVVFEAVVKGSDGVYSEVKVAEDGKLLKYKAGRVGQPHVEMIK